MTLGILLAKNVRTWRDAVWSAGLSAAALTSHTLYQVPLRYGNVLMCFIRIFLCEYFIVC